MQTDVSLPDMNPGLLWTSSTATAERDVPVIRLKNDENLREIYEFGKKLGQGSFGAVYEATHIETQTKWAIKEICRPKAGSQKVWMVENEINILKQVNHAHIIHLEAIYTSVKMIYLVTELCKGGDLKQLLQQKQCFTEDETRKIIFCLVDAVVYLHKKDIVHRDLKLENILLKNSVDEEDGKFDIKVADFGLSVKTHGVGIGNIMMEACGTLIYMAPEVMRGRGYSQWCDIWSIGVIMFMLLCGEPPFVSRTKKDLLKKILTKEVRFTQPAWASVSEAAKYVLSYLLKADPAYRMSACQLLESPWINGDTTVSSGLANALEMMHDYLEHEENTKSAKDSSLVSFEKTLKLSQDHSETSPEDLSLERDSGSSMPSISNKTTNESSQTTQQENCTHTTDTTGPLPIPTQRLVGVKRPTLLSAKKRGHQIKNGLSSGQKPTSCSSKTVEKRRSSRSRLSPVIQQPAQSPVNKTREKKKRDISHEKTSGGL